MEGGGRRGPRCSRGGVAGVGRTGGAGRRRDGVEGGRRVGRSPVARDEVIMDRRGGREGHLRCELGVGRGDFDVESEGGQNVLPSRDRVLEAGPALRAIRGRLNHAAENMMREKNNAAKHMLRKKMD